MIFADKRGKQVQFARCNKKKTERVFISMIVLKVRVKNMLNMKIEIRNLFLLTIVTALLNLAAATSSASSNNFISLDEFNSSPTRHNHRHHPSTHQQQQQPQKDNFILIDYLSDGERERRISWNGITGKETSIGDVR